MAAKEVKFSTDARNRMLKHCLGVTLARCLKAANQTTKASLITIGTTGRPL